MGREKKKQEPIAKGSQFIREVIEKDDPSSVKRKKLSIGTL